MKQNGYMVEILLVWVFLLVALPLIVWRVSGSLLAGLGIILAIWGLVAWISREPPRDEQLEERG